MKIYTKGGDGGQTSLYGGRRLPKSHLRIEVYGTVDELNSWLGKLTAEGIPDNCAHFLNAIQQDLFLMGSHLAATEEVRHNLPVWSERAELKIEKEIDLMDAVLPPLMNFILPGAPRLPQPPIYVVAFVAVLNVCWLPFQWMKRFHPGCSDI